MHLRFGEAPGDSRARRPGANDQNVNWFGHVELSAVNARRPVDEARG
jgi:hypothetical protein